MTKKLVFLCVYLMTGLITMTAYTRKHNMNNMGNDQKSKKSGMMMDMTQMDRHFIERMIPSPPGCD